MLTTLIVGNVSNNDGDGYERADASNFIALIPSRSIRQVLAFHWSWILKDCIEVQEKKRNVVVLRSRAPQNVKMGIFMS